ncbi:MAG: zf-HC2 domain-containing protein [Geovibrio sp.]|nr:zf-HC2 domain-containing protein [Geovibrio sp.]MCD8569251.1 zf-HC2 domain-containing protein [Geovibrio sp.]
MDCTKHRKLLSAYVDGECSQFESAAVEAHLKKCAPCRNELSELYTLGSMVTEGYSKTEDVDFTSSIMSSIMADSGESVAVVSKSRKKLIGFSSVAAALVAGLMAFAVMNPAETESVASGNEKLERYVFEHVASTYGSSSDEIGVVNFGQ